MPRTRSRLTNTKPHLKLIKAAVKESLDKDVAPFIQKYLHALLESNRDASGKQRPSTKPAGRKKESTIRQYKRKGWNTETYLVRTGESIKLKHKIGKGGTRLTVEPASSKGRKILSYHIPKSAHRGEIHWMELNTKAEHKIIKRIRNRVRKRLS